MKAIINGETIEFGSSGVTFTPSVSPEGELSWSNDGCLGNPEPVNIKGPTGEPGNTPFIGENGNWWIGETDTGVAASGTVLPVKAPVGAIVWWSGAIDTIPVGWHICDGTNGTIDLRDKFILTAGDEHEVGETGGSEEVTLTVEQMPRHSHGIAQAYGTGGSSTAWHLPASTLRTTASNISYYNAVSNTGSSKPHSNMPPYYVLCAIQKIAPDETDTASNNYSTEEQVIGTWIDGKPLYRKSFIFEIPSYNSGAILKLIDNVVPNLGVVRNLDGTVYSTKYNRWYGSCVIGSSGAGASALFLSIADGGLYLYVGASDIFANGRLYCSIEYTKSSDQTVSQSTVQSELSRIVVNGIAETAMPVTISNAETLQLSQTE